MEPKNPITIDGIDVSGCECFIEKMDFPNNLEGGYYNQKNLCECGIQGVESYPFFCKDNPNCYYKQLKHEEQRCKESNKQVEIFTRQLEKANKEVIKEKEKNATQRQKNDKLEQALIVIEDIAKDMNSECFYSDFDCKDCDMKNGCIHQGRLKILQKISEVTNE